MVFLSDPVFMVWYFSGSPTLCHEVWQAARLPLSQTTYSQDTKIGSGQGSRRAYFTISLFSY
jgi:hypothetical protein